MGYSRSHGVAGKDVRAEEGPQGWTSDTFLVSFGWPNPILPSHFFTYGDIRSHKVYERLLTPHLPDVVVFTEFLGLFCEYLDSYKYFVNI